MAFVDDKYNVWITMPTGVSDDGTTYWDEDPEVPEEVELDLSTIQYVTSKQGVCNTCHVTGYLGERDPATGGWFLQQEKATSVTVVSNQATTLLNGETVEMSANIDEDYLLLDEEQLRQFGKRELQKTLFGARGVTWDGENVPLNVYVGSSIAGTGQVGTLGGIITAISRTTDALQGVVNTSITGTDTGLPDQTGGSDNGTEEDSSGSNFTDGYDKIGWI